MGNQRRKYSPEFKDEAVKLVIIALLEARSMTNAKAADKVRMEGKVYLMADVDMMMEFRFNMHHGEFAKAQRVLPLPVHTESARASAEWSRAACRAAN